MFAALRRALSAPTPARAPAQARYMRPDSAGVLRGWNPALRSQNDDVREAWTGVAARVIDGVQNRGWLSGAVDQAVGDTVGVGLILNATPDAEALGWSQDEAHDWSRRAERGFRAYAANPLECDARGKQTLHQLAANCVRYGLTFGEGVGRFLLRERAGAQYLTKVQMLSPHRLCQDSSDLEGMHQGVALDADGMPVGYRFRGRANGFDRTTDVRARDADGRPLVFHVFDGAPDQVRGISPMASSLKVARQFDQLADATLTTALLQTIFAATLESSLPSDAALEGLFTDQDLGAAAKRVDPAAQGGMAALVASRAEWYSAAEIDLGVHGRINTTFPGDSLKFNQAQHPGSNYLPFSADLKRELARGCGVTYESMTGDYQGATFSSLKMGISSIWPVVLRRRATGPARMLQLAYEAWLEEAVATGRLAFKGGYAAFLKRRAAACQAEWRGPAKPTADELKTAKALQTYRASGVFSLSTASAEVGVDWETEAQSKAQESAYYRSLGLLDPHAVPLAPAAPDGPEDERGAGVVAA